MKLVDSKYLDVKYRSEILFFVMFFSCLGYAFFKISNRYVGDIFQTVVFLGGLIYFLRNHNRTEVRPMLYMLLLSLLIAVSGWVSSLINTPEFSRSTPKFGDLAYFMFFVFLAPWLKGSRERILAFWFAFSLGGIYTLYRNSSGFLNEILNALSGYRVDFDFINANHSAALFGSILIVNLWIFITSYNDIYKYRYLILSISFFMSVVSLFVVIFTQSRQVWLALFLVLIFVLFSLAKLKPSRTLMASVIFFILFFSFMRIEIVENRLNDEREFLNQMLEYNIDTLPYTSVGIRIHLAYESLAWLKMYPLFGAGHDAKALVITTSDRLPDFITDEFRHLHNGYLEVLVGYGIVGLLFFLILFYILAKYSLRRNLLKSVWFLYASFLIFFMIINMFESFLNFKTGQYIFCCVSAGVYASYMSGFRSEKGVLND